MNCCKFGNFHVTLIWRNFMFPNYSQGFEFVNECSCSISGDRDFLLVRILNARHGICEYSGKLSFFKHFRIYGKYMTSSCPALCLFVWRCNILVNNFSVMWGQRHHFLDINQYSWELMCLAQGHNMVPQVGIEHRTSQFRV